MNTKLKNSIDWLLPAFLILFILEVIAFPFAVGLTYAGRSEDPDHTLTYQARKLTWSAVEGIDANGAAQLSIFDAEYQSVSASDGSAVIAPGTEGFHIIRFKNNADHKIAFTAVLYAIPSDSALPVEVSLSDGAFADAAPNRLPEGVKEEQVIRSVSGSVNKSEIVDFDISWLWQYETGAEQDRIDVDFGDRSAEGSPDEIKVGFYLVVEDEGALHLPETGDNTRMTLYILLMGISGAMLLILVIFQKREKKGK